MRYFDPRDYGVRLDGISDDSAGWQEVIGAQQARGGIIQHPGGVSPISTGLIPAPGKAGVYTDAKYPLLIHGLGQRASVFLATSPYTFGGMFGYAMGFRQAQVFMQDLTLDGNYSGVTGGSLAQAKDGQQGALLCLPPPFQRAGSTKTDGLYHLFTRVHFYRPTGFVSQPTNGNQFQNCLFEGCGQPDLPVAGLHWDNLGSGPGDAIVNASTWKDSSGNYADFISGTPGDLIRLIFTANVSRNHQIGGIYACGRGSIITSNRLQNMNPGSGIGYDGGTAMANRGANLVADNLLDNLTVDPTLKAA